MRKHKKHIYLPIRIPKNIIDCLIDYWNWAQNKETYPKKKIQILEELSAKLKRWHLYLYFESMGGSFFIYTKPGVVVVSHIGEKKDLIIHQYTNVNPFKGLYERREDIITEYKGQKYKIHIENYKPFFPLKESLPE